MFGPNRMKLYWVAVRDQVLEIAEENRRAERAKDVIVNLDRSLNVSKSLEGQFTDSSLRAFPRPLVSSPSHQIRSA